MPHHTVVIEFHDQTFGTIVSDDPVFALLINPNGMTILDTYFEGFSKHESNIFPRGFSILNGLGLLDIKISTDGSTPNGQRKAKE
jgi:hypothetical protein